jgi:hypothetical protein
MSIQSLETTRVPILGLPFGNLEKKCHLDEAPIDNHKIYYREGSASSQKVVSYVKLMLEVIPTKYTTPLIFNLH